MNTLVMKPSDPPLHPLLAGFRASWVSILLIAAISTGIAAVLWIEDPRPFWQPLVTCQIYGFCIAYCVNVASPWNRTHAIRQLAGAVAAGSLIGVVLVVLVKGYPLAYVREHAPTFGWNIFAAFLNGLFVSLFFYVKFREARAEAALLKANAERLLLSRQAIEAELKLMQAQVEPHFLFNTLASVQYLTETDPPRANELLGSPDRLPARRVAADARGVDHAGQGGGSCPGLPQHPGDADGRTLARAHRRPCRSCVPTPFPRTCSYRWSKIRSSMAWNRR